jgi:UDP-N-acetylmuramoyl-tripeptide--D-alanyl-D-alanine ligase
MAGAHKVISFGFAEGSDVRGWADSIHSSWKGEGFQTRFLCDYQGESHEIVLRLAGKHNVANALAAAASCLGLGIGFPQIAEGLSRLAPVSGRIQPDRAGNGALLINDTYNANPSSFKAALEVLLDLPGEPWVAMGAFGELGAVSSELHEELGGLAKAMGVARMFVTGPNANKTAEAFGSGARFFPRQEDLIETLQEELREDVALLVKGSRSQRMEKVIEALRAGKVTCC